jgi:hypothetical protein
MKRKGKELAAIEVQVAGEPQVNPVLCMLWPNKQVVKFSNQN